MTTQLTLPAQAHSETSVAAALAAWQQSEPERLDAVAQSWLDEFNGSDKGWRRSSRQMRLCTLITGARKAAANLRAMREARRRIELLTPGLLK